MILVSDLVYAIVQEQPGSVQSLCCTYVFRASDINKCITNKLQLSMNIELLIRVLAIVYIYGGTECTQSDDVRDSPLDCIGGTECTQSDDVRDSPLDCIGGTECTQSDDMRDSPLDCIGGTECTQSDDMRDSPLDYIGK